MITLDDEAKARELLAQRGGYLAKANGKFCVMSAEEYVHYTKPPKTHLQALITTTQMLHCDSANVYWIRK
jgi:hypothetical protein